MAAPAPLVTRLLSWLLPSRRLHHLGLLWMCRDVHGPAALLMEAAARRCHRELDVRRLASIRIHQLMLSVRAGSDREHEVEQCLEVERALCRVDKLEGLEPPFGLVESRLLLARWLDQPRVATASAEPLPVPRAA